MEYGHPLDSGQDWAKGISHRHGNSTNAPVSPKIMCCPNAVGSLLYFYICALPSAKVYIFLYCFLKMHLAVWKQSSIYLLMWACFLATASKNFQAGSNVNTTQEGEVCHQSFSDRCNNSCCWWLLLRTECISTYHSVFTVNCEHVCIKESFINLALYSITHFVRKQNVMQL